MKSCPFCGAKIEDSARFCLTCMSSLDEKQVWRAPRRHHTRWQACLAAVSAVAVAAGVVFFSLKMPPADMPVGGATSSESERIDSTSYTGWTSIVTNPVTTLIVTNPVTTSIVTNPVTTSIVTNPVTTSIIEQNGTSTVVTNRRTTSIVTNRRTTSIVTSPTTTPTSVGTSTTPATTSTAIKTATDHGKFVPDYRPGYANTEGNTTYNVFNNNGLIAKQDEWLYYSANYALYKARTDGTEKQMITKIKHQTVCYLNVIGDYLYYRILNDGIYRVRTDGSGAELIVAKDAYQLYITENYGYFSNDYGVYQFDLKTNELKRINYSISSGKICYLSEKDDVLIGFTNRKGGVKSELSKYKLSSPDSLQWEMGNDEYFGTPYHCIVAGNTMFYICAFSDVTNIYRANWRSNSTPTAEVFYNYQGFTFGKFFCYSPYRGGVLATKMRKSTPLAMSERIEGANFIFMDGMTSFIEGTETDTTYVYDVISPYNFGDDYVYYLKDDQLYRANGDCSNPVQLTK